MDSICEDVLSAFKRRNFKKLKKASRLSLFKAVQSWSRSNFLVSLYAYVLSKICSKSRFLSRSYSPYLKKIDDALTSFCASVESGSPDDSNLRSALLETEGLDRRYVNTLLNKGRVKLASEIYAMGYSIGSASELSGADRHDILDYVGKTYINERSKSSVPLEKRISWAMELLK